MTNEEQKAYDLAVDNHARAMDRVAELEVELAALRPAQPAPAEQVEVVGWRRLDRPYELTAYPSVCAMWHGVGYPVQALYTRPATVPAGCKVVKVERIAIALDAVQNAMGDAYNNAYQDCCGRGQGECCGNPIVAWSDADQAIMDALAPAQRELSALLASAILEVKDE